uniref:Uncharacterized protein n=1 Tax=Kwoniella pini CBS 10737 TaxID=1296096 RepID=A0A1B9IDA6_9TREE|nr:uncharacterized protein I206_00706 [Kwoniella pini CBS 10737]OCF53404.1 hypothetical protein I206_00706 [Kwoniella pini CBS 10737]
MEDHTFDLEDDHDNTHQHLEDHDDHDDNLHDQVTHDDVAAEAVLASLRAVINDPDSHNTANNHSDNILDHVNVDVNIEGEEELLHQKNTSTHTSEDLLGNLHEHDQNDETLQEFVHDHDQEANLDQNGHLTEPTTIQHPLIVWFEHGLSSIEKAISDNKLVVDELNSPNAIQNLAQNLRALGEGSKKESEIINDLKERLKVFKQEPGITIGGENILQALTTNLGAEESPFVLRTEYDLLKADYDTLVNSSTGKKGSKKGGAKKPNQEKGHKNGEDSLTPLREAVNQSILQQDDQMPGVEGRKKRSIKLEHLVHKMANRRLGVEYQVTNFESKGSRQLPDPSSIPPKADEAINGVDEYRPDFQADINSATVKPFIDQVVEDCMDALKDSMSDEPDIDRERIIGGVQIYWARLSLLARRLAAFDSSPLNICRLRALYRTLLTIDFAAPTQDTPDPKREYTEDEWKAYRKLACGRRAAEAHEVIDQFWLSPMARNLLTILDVYWADMNARARKKGRPKQPNPTFHLPPHLWDRSSLPTIRPKDATGLPIPNAQGIVLFKFHVDEQVQKDNPEWAQGLYDNPPISEENSRLPSLTEVMALSIYIPLKAPLKAAKEKSNPAIIPLDQVEEILSRPDRSPTPPPPASLPISQEGQNPPSVSSVNANPLEIDQSLDSSFIGDVPNTGNSENEYATLLALNRLEKLSPDVNMEISESSDNTMNGNNNNNNKRKRNTSSLPPGTENLFIIPATSNILGNLTPVNEPVPGPSAGSSWRARKLGKRLASEVPGGAATPVPKRIKTKLNQSVSLGLDDTALVGIEGEFINHPDDNILVSDGQVMPDDDDEEDERVNEEVLGDAAFLDSL